MKKIIPQTIIPKLWLILIISIMSINSNAQNLLINGNFETSGSNFVIDQYTLINTPNGTSTPGSYTKTTDPTLFNSNYISGGDHTTGTGNMLVFDGAAGKFFWGTGGGPNPIGGFTIGKTYTFSYWIKAVSNEVTNSATRTNIQIYIINGSNPNPAALTQLGPLPSEGWKKISYSFVAQQTSVMIRLQTIGGTAVGNDFAVDDFSLTEGAMPFTGTVDQTNPTCPSNADGSITVNLSGGTLPFGTYNLTGTATKSNTTGLFTGLATGTYAVSGTDANGQSFSQSNIVLAAPNDLVLSGPTTVCPGQPTTLSVSGGLGTYTWTASPADPSLTDPNSANPTVSPLVATTYTVTSGTVLATPPTNLVVNGDFSQGNTGFLTEYSHITDPTVYGTQTAYDIVTNPNAWFGPFSNMGDHTTGSGLMMVADGATDPAGDFLVWRNSAPITVVPNKDYTLSYYIASVASGNPAQMEVFINGVSLGTPIAAPITTGVWMIHSFNWNSGANTTATISILDREIQGNGNDFAIDDISLKESTTCVYQKSVTIGVNTPTTPTFTLTQPTCAVQTGSIEITSALPNGTEYSLDNGTALLTSTFNSIAPGNHTITFPNFATGCFAPITFTIDPVPTTPTELTFSYTTPVCKNAATNPSPTTATGFTTGGIYSATPAGLSIDPITGSVDLSSTTPGTYDVTYTVAPDNTICLTGGSFTTSIEISTDITPVTAISYTTPVCITGTNPVPTTATGFTTGGTYSATPTGLAIDSTTGAITLASSTSGAYDVTYTIAEDTSTCLRAGSTTTSIVINPETTPVTAISYTTPVCISGANPVPTTATGFTTGGTYSATPAGLSIASTTGVVDLSASTSGTYDITYTIAADISTCLIAGSTTTSIVINPEVTPVTTFSYTTPVCITGANPVPTTAAGFTTGGTYSVTPAGLSIDPATGVVDLSSTTAGTYDVTYTVAPDNAICLTGGSFTTSIEISSDITPVTAISYATPICITGTNPVPSTATGFTTGGTYSATPTGLAIDSTTGAITLSSSTSGTYDVTYTIAADSNTCLRAGSTTTSIVINPQITPVTAFTYTTPVCIAGANPLPTTVAGFTTGGTYSATPAGLVIDSTTGEINLLSSTSGTYTVAYTVAADNTSCLAAGSSTSTIVINPEITPVTTISYISPVCISGANPVPTTAAGFTTGGTYSATPVGLAIDSTTGEINLSSSTSGIYTVAYTVAADNATCLAAGSSTATIVIDPQVTPVTAISYTTPVCIAGTNPVPATAVGFTTGGTYSATPAGLAIDSTTGAITLSSSASGTYTVAYTVASNNTTCLAAGSSTTTIVINPQITAVTAISYTTPVCIAGVNPVPTTGAGFTTGGTYSATPTGLSVDSTTGAINLSSSAAGTYTVAYTVASNNTTCLAAGSSTATIEIDPQITPVTAISYTTPVCITGTNPVPTTAVGFTTGGTYTATPAGLSIDATTGAIDLSSSASGTYTVKYTVNSNTANCLAAGSTTTTITVNPEIAPVTGISYTTPVCITGANPLPTTASGFTTGGTYTATPVGLSIDSTTGAIDLSSSTNGTYTVKYTVNSNTANCLAAGSTTTTITVNPEITPVTGISYATPVCSGAANPLPTTAAGFTTGGTYTASSAGLSINATTGEINLSASTPGSYTVQYTIDPNTALCLAGGSFTTAIVINPAITPITAISYATPICSGEGNQLPITAAGFTTGGTYTAKSAGLSIDTTTGEIDLSASSSGTYTVEYTIAANTSTCQNASSGTAQIAIAAPIEAEITGVCDGNNYVLTASPANNSFNSNTVTYSWKGSNGNDAGHTQSIVVTKADTYTVQITSGACNGNAELTVDAISCTIQKGISVNNDGKNDTFDLTQLNVKHLSIFNRYGVKVYSLANYTNQWGGKSDKGDELPDGTYYYVIDRENDKAITGWIYINRAH